MKTEINYDNVNDLYDEYIKGLTEDEVIELKSNIEKYTLENITYSKIKKILDIILPTFVCCILISIYLNSPISILIFSFLSLLTWIGFRLISKEIKINKIVIEGIEKDVQKYNLYNLNNSKSFNME